MRRIWLLAILSCSNTLAAADGASFDEAFRDLYNFHFQASHQVIDSYIAVHPQDPLPYAVRASAYLFYELDRLGILESEFLIDDKRIAKKDNPPSPDGKVRTQLNHALDDTQSRALAALKLNPNDKIALFSMCIAQGVTTDYMAFVEKHQFRSLSPAEQSNSYAQRLLKLDPQYYDAYLTAGLSEYLVGSLPFFVRWFVHFDNVNGSKEKGVHNLEMVANSGHYLRPFGKILLGIIDLREKKYRDAQRLLVDLSRDYPENPLFHKELVKLNAKLGDSGN